MNPENENDPFARLCHTHRRIEERLVTLERAAIDVSDSALRMDALNAVYDVVGFFERAGARHHEDEERSLFPSLRAVASLAPLLAALEEEHRAHQAVFAELSALVGGFSDEGPERKDEESLRTLSARLAEIYRAHIEREEKDLFPAARAALTPEDIVRIAKDMTERRGERGGGRHRHQT